MTRPSPTPADIAVTRARFERATPKTPEDLSRVLSLNEVSNQQFANLAEFLLATVPEGRELTLALDHMQTAKFFVNEARIQAIRAEDEAAAEEVPTDG